jgi:tRNA-dihydrouridine synthase
MARLVLAPLRGVTVRLFRECFQRHFGGLDGAVSPFLTTIAGAKIKATHLADILPEANATLPLVPQVIGKNPAEFTTLLAAIRDLGYSRCDLNAGCPFPMIVKRGRGAGLLRDADALRRMLDAGCAALPDHGLSVKVRLGIDAPGLLLERMELFNEYPLAELTIHARTSRQRYEGEVDLDAFADCLAAAKMPVVYNGDIRTAEDLARLRTRFPSVAGWMVGRGAVTDPFLALRIRGKAPARGEEPARIRAFAEEYAERTKAELFGPAPFLGRMKELWSYLHACFEDGDRLWRELRLARSFGDYDDILRRWWASRPRTAPIASTLPGFAPISGMTQMPRSAACATSSRKSDAE